MKKVTSYVYLLLKFSLFSSKTISNDFPNFFTSQHHNIDIPFLLYLVRIHAQLNLQPAKYLVKTSKLSQTNLTLKLYLTFSYDASS